MPKTYYDSELTGTQIEDALEAIHDVVTPSNNGKVLYIDNGQIKAASASRWGHGAVLEPLSVTANGDYTPPTGTDGFDSVHVAVPSATLTTKSITQNGTYNASQDNADGYSSVTVNVSGSGSAVVQPLSVTQNGTYNPPSGVDGYAPVTVNVSGGTSDPVIGNWEQGGVDSTRGGSYRNVKTSSSASNYHTRVRTVGMTNLDVGSSYEVTVNNTYKVDVLMFTTDGQYVATSYGDRWQDTFSFTTEYPYMTFMFKKSDDSNISPSDFESTGIAIHKVNGGTQ